VAERAPPAGVVLTAASAAQASVSVVNFGLPSIGPTLGSEYDLSLFELGAVLSAGLLGAGIALVPAGIAVDRFGARRALIAGTAVSVVGLSVASATLPKGALYLALFVFGLGSAAVTVGGAGALFRAYPPARRGWAMGVRQTAVPLGGTIGAVGFPLLEAAGGVRLPLLVAGAAVGVTGLAFAAVAGRHAVKAGRVSRPFRTIWSAPGMVRLLAVAACYIVVLQALLAFVVPAVRAAGYAALVASIAYVAVNVAAMAARIAWGKVADRDTGARRSRTLVEIGLVASGGALLFAGALHLGPVATVAGAVLFGVGALGWNAVVYVSAGERAQPALVSRSVAVAATVVFVLSGVATPALGALVDAAGWNALWIVASCIAALGVLLAAGLSDSPP
jgi:MFS family permease